MGHKQRRQLTRLRAENAALKLHGEAVLRQNRILSRALHRAIIIGSVEGVEIYPHPLVCTLTVTAKSLPRSVSVESLEPLVAACVGRSLEELQRRAAMAQGAPVVADPAAVIAPTFRGVPVAPLNVFPESHYRGDGGLRDRPAADRAQDARGHPPAPGAAPGG